MKYIQGDHPIWSVVKNAYTHNDQPIIFAIFNLCLLIAIGVTIYGIIKWKKDGIQYRFMTIFSGIVTIGLISYIMVFLFVQDNKVGHYEGTADVTFTASINSSDSKVARLADKDANDINSIVMDGKTMDDLGIKAGRTIEVESKNMKKPNDDKAFIYLEKDDVKEVKDTKSIDDYNDKQQAEEKAQKEKEEKAKKEKEDKKKKDKDKEK